MVRRDAPYESWGSPVNFWKNEMAPAPIDMAAIASFESSHGFRFPACFRQQMSLHNGGIIRIGPLHWWLFQIPGSGHNFPEPIMWLGRECTDLPSFMNAAMAMKSFPKNAIPIGLRLFTGSADGLLCLLRSEQDPAVLKDEVWAWYWYKKPMRQVLPSTCELWRDNPFRIPKPKQDWKVKRQKRDFPAGLSIKTKASRGTETQPEDLGWMHVMSTEVLGHKIGVTDGAGGAWDECIVASTEPGTHDVFVRIMAYGKFRRIGGCRMIRQGFASTGISPLGSVAIDLGSALFSDIEPILTCEEVVLEALWDRLSDLTLESRLLACLAFGPTTMIQVSSGWGDGSYPAFQLRDGETPVGIEVRFME